MRNDFEFVFTVNMLSIVISSFVISYFLSSPSPRSMDAVAVYNSEPLVRACEGPANGFLCAVHVVGGSLSIN